MPIINLSESQNKEYDVIVIGSGIAGLSSSCYLAKSGKKVLVVEKNEQLGGRLSSFEDSGFMFDMGPSWIWMVDIFDQFFQDFGESFTDLEFVRLQPQFRMFFGDRFIKESDSTKGIGNSAFKKNINYVDLPDQLTEIYSVFDSLEQNGSDKLKDFLKHGANTYKKGVYDYMQRRSESVLEFLDWEFLRGIFRAGLLDSYGKQIKKQFKNPIIQEILNFPILFLGATPENTPYFYSLMAYSMLSGGTTYTKGGIREILNKITNIADKLGVDFLLNQKVVEIQTDNNQPSGVVLTPNQDVFYNSTQDFKNSNKLFEKASVNNKSNNFNSLATNLESNLNIKLKTDKKESELEDETNQSTLLKSKHLILALDYQHGESLLPKKYQRYSQKYWQKKVFAPSSILYYLGFDRKIPGLEHHNLFFDTDFKEHVEQIYKTKLWPDNPLFYTCCPSKTDLSVAPSSSENIFILIPVATNLETQTNLDTQEYYLNNSLKRIEQNLSLSFELKNHLKVCHYFGPSDFINRYNSFGGNAYGLANTLLQTAVFKPKMRSKLEKTFFVGQLTVPGPGLPPCLISGKIGAEMLLESW